MTGLDRVGIDKVSEFFLVEKKHPSHSDARKGIRFATGTVPVNPGLRPAG